MKYWYQFKTTAEPSFQRCLLHLCYIVIVVFYISSFLWCCLFSAGVSAGAGAPSAWWGGEGQEETWGRQQIHSGVWDGEEQEWAGRAHQKVKDTHTNVKDFIICETGSFSAYMIKVGNWRNQQEQAGFWKHPTKKDPASSLFYPCWEIFNKYNKEYF